MIAENESTGTVDRKAVSDEITSLEVALAKIPNEGEYTGFRASLQAKIDEKKKSLVRSKPIGIQVDSCQKFVSRCQTRRDQAEQGVKLAQQALKTAQQTLAEAEVELYSAQAELKDRQEEMALEMAQQDPASSRNSMKGLTTACDKVIQDMKAGGMVSAQHIGETEQHMKALKEGLNAIATAVAEQNAAVSLATAVGGTGMLGIGTPVQGDIDIAGEMQKRSGEADANTIATRRRLEGKAGGAPQFVPPDTPARSDAEEGLMQAFPPQQSHPSPG